MYRNLKFLFFLPMKIKKKKISKAAYLSKIAEIFSTGLAAQMAHKIGFRSTKIVWIFRMGFRYVWHCKAQGSLRDWFPTLVSYLALFSKQPTVNFSPMSPKLLLTYPHREEDRGIAMASLFLKLMLLKVLPNQLKIFVNMTFSPKV